MDRLLRPRRREGPSRRRPLASQLPSCALRPSARTWRVALAGLAIPLAATAAPPVLRTPPVVVTATKTERPADELASSVTVIGPETLRRAESRDVLELLRDVPGLHVARTGSRGGTTSVFARGGASDHNLVLVDGVQVNRSGGAFDFSTLTTENIERIEVVRGPTSGLWGSDGLASTIHIVTRRGAGPPSGELRVEGGSHETFEGTARLGGGSERGGASLSLAHSRTDGLEMNNGFRNSRARLRADWRPSSRLAFGLTAWHGRSAFDFPTDFVPGVRGGFPAVDPDQGSERRETVVGLEGTFEAEPGWTHDLHVGYAASRRHFEDPLDPIPSDFADQESTDRERRLSADYRQVVSTEPLDGLRATGTAGLEWERQWFRQSSSTRLPGLPETTTRANADRRDLGLYALLELELLERLNVRAGLRGDEHSDFGWVTSPYARLLWRVPETGTRLRAAVGRGFTEPSFLETFGSAVVRGNPDLEPERSTSWEVGLEQALLEGRVRAFATWFDEEFRELIAFVGPLGGSVATFENVRRVESQGVEIGLDARLHRTLHLGLSYTWLDMRVTETGGLRAPGFREGKPLVARPHHEGSFHVTWSREPVDLRLSGTVVGPRDDLDFGRSPTERVRSEGYLRLDLFASALVYRSASGRVELRLLGTVENLLDEDYEERFGFASAGLQARGGLELRF